jgi:hypothetical protein
VREFFIDWDVWVCGIGLYLAGLWFLWWVVRRGEK